jgi:hypothetical protein
VDNPLCFWLRVCFWLGVGIWLRGSGGVLGRNWAQLEDDVLAGSVNPENDAASQALCLTGARSFKGLCMRAEPRIDDAIQAQALVNSAGDGFNFGQFGHWSILLELFFLCCGLIHPSRKNKDAARMGHQGFTPFRRIAPERFENSRIRRMGCIEANRRIEGINYREARVWPLKSWRQLVAWQEAVQRA